MTLCCAHCARLATAKIPTVPEDVCAAHAYEFWTELLVYVADRRDAKKTGAPEAVTSGGSGTSHMYEVSKASDDEGQQPMSMAS